VFYFDSLGAVDPAVKLNQLRELLVTMCDHV